MIRRNVVAEVKCDLNSGLVTPHDPWWPHVSFGTYTSGHLGGASLPAIYRRRIPSGQAGG